MRLTVLTAILAASVGATGASAADTCCYANARFSGPCVVTLAPGETCSSVLAYLNNLSSGGKTYCGSTPIRRGWSHTTCPGEVVSGGAVPVQPVPVQPGPGARPVPTVATGGDARVVSPDQTRPGSVVGPQAAPVQQAPGAVDLRDLTISVRLDDAVDPGSVSADDETAIDGEWVDSEGEKRDVVNPATMQTIARVPRSTAAEFDAAVQAAKAAFPEWRRTPHLARARCMFRLKELLEENFEEVSRIQTMEHGKTIDESRGETRRGIEMVEVATGIPTLMMGTNLEDVASGIDEYLIRQPLVHFFVLGAALFVLSAVYSQQLHQDEGLSFPAIKSGALLAIIGDELREYFMQFVNDDPARFDRCESDVPAIRYLNTRTSADGFRIIAEPVRAADIDELMRYLPGPDFPTGAIINGRAGIVQAYRTGRGRMPRPRRRALRASPAGTMARVRLGRSASP